MVCIRNGPPTPISRDLCGRVWHADFFYLSALSFYLRICHRLKAEFSSAVRRVMSGVLDADRTRLEDVEAEMLGLKQTFNLLRTEKSSIQARLQAYRYPVLTLPNEIVSDIFLHFLPAYPNYPSTTGLFSPTLLTHICRKWRQIALTTPSLWRAIPFPLDLDPSQCVPMLQSWLARSCVCPVSVKINDLPRKDVEDALHALLPHRLRCEYLKLELYASQLYILEGPKPLLRELNLVLHEAPSSLFLIKDVPLLRKAVLNHYASTEVMLPWAQLTSLSLRAVYPFECSPILLHTCNLVHCELYLEVDDEDAIEPDVKLPSLESLIIVGEAGSPVRKYLGTFIVPALRKLQVPEAYIGLHPITELISFISKSGCKLQDVRITGRRLTAEALYRNALSLVPNLTFDERSSMSPEP
ncbi:hypothetical protein C8R43DRAFT_309973 [Mycena crocata]|nr:hypothetical protein C8R43DRAFT_309973 [Mycena crocata]